MKRIIIVLFIALFSIVIVSADGVDDQGNPNDPNTNDRANACYEDGIMANRCETELDWQAGWYLIRFEFGLLSRDEIPAWVVWVLPPEIVPEPLAVIPGFIYPGTNCEQYSATGWTRFGGGNYVTTNNTRLTNATCTARVGGASVINITIAYAPEGPLAADDICRANSWSSSILYYAPNIYRCI